MSHSFLRSPEPSGPSSAPLVHGPRRTWDAVLSWMVLVLAYAVVALGAMAGLMQMAFFDFCPPESCHAEPAIGSLLLGVALAVTLCVVSAIHCHRRIGLGRLTWPLALLLAVAMVASVVLGEVGFFTFAG